MTRKPAEAGGWICLCQEYQNSGKPWRRTTTGPSGGPAATAWSSIAPLRKATCSRAVDTGAEFTLNGKVEMGMVWSNVTGDSRWMQTALSLATAGGSCGYVMEVVSRP